MLVHGVQNVAVQIIVLDEFSNQVSNPARTSVAQFQPWKQHISVHRVDRLDVGEDVVLLETQTLR